MSDKVFTGYRLCIYGEDGFDIGHFVDYPHADMNFATDDIYQTEYEAKEALIALKEQLDIPLTTREKVIRLKIQKRQEKEVEETTAL